MNTTPQASLTIGDRVRLVRTRYFAEAGAVGTVCAIYLIADRLEVQFDSLRTAHVVSPADVERLQSDD